MGTIVLDLEENTGKLHKFKFKIFYYFHGSSNILISPHKWAYDRGKSEVGQEGT